jgi:hypothetical protein
MVESRSGSIICASASNSMRDEVTYGQLPRLADPIHPWERYPLRQLSFTATRLHTHVLGHVDGKLISLVKVIQHRSKTPWDISKPVKGCCRSVKSHMAGGRLTLWAQESAVRKLEALVGVSVTFIADIAGLDSMTCVELVVSTLSVGPRVTLTFMP